MAAPSERSTSDRLEVGDGKGNNGIDVDSIGSDSMKLAKKLGKSRGQKLANS